MTRSRSTPRLLGGTAGLVVWMLACAACAQSCSVSSVGASFGDYDYLNGNSTTGTVTLGCTANTVLKDVTVALSAGATGGATVSNRMMSQQVPAGGDRLGYGLFQNATSGPLCAGGIVWGDTAATEPAPIGTLPLTSGRTRTWTVYGCMRSGQDVTVATYGDTVTVTVAWN